MRPSLCRGRHQDKQLYVYFICTTPDWVFVVVVIVPCSSQTSIRFPGRERQRTSYLSLFSSNSIAIVILVHWSFIIVIHPPPMHKFTSHRLLCIFIIYIIGHHKQGGAARHHCSTLPRSQHHHHMSITGQCHVHVTATWHQQKLLIVSKWNI